MADQLIEKAVQKYIQMRDDKREIQDQHKDQLAPYNEAMKKIEDLVLGVMIQKGANSIKTPKGTVYTSTTVRPKIDDWKELRPFILENDLIDMMVLKLSPDAVEQFRESTGDLPPGVVITSETYARFKK